MGTKEKVLDLIEHTYQEKHAFMQSLTDAQRALVGTSQQWSAKDILAHVVVWQERVIDNHQAALRGVTPPTYDDFNHENELIFQAHRDDSWDDMRHKVENVHHKQVAWLQAMTEDDLTNPACFPWLNNRPLWGRVIGNSVIHPLLHFAEFYANHGQRDYATQLQESLVAPLLALSDSPAWRASTLYNLACYYSLAGLKDKAIAQLAEALPLDPNLIEWSKQDTDLNALRDDPAYQALYAG
jgi:hypothetical protein